MENKLKKINFEIEVEKAKDLIKEIKKHIHKEATSVIFNLECFQDKWDKSHSVVRFNVEYGGEK